MKPTYRLILFLVFVVLVSCEKNNEGNSSQNAIESSDFLIELGKESTLNNVDSIINPSPVQQNAFSTVYSFMLSDDGSQKLHIRHVSSIDSSNTSLFINEWVEVDVESIISDSNQSSIINSVSTNGDSTSLLSSYSPYSPLTNTTSVNSTVDRYPAMFNAASKLDLMNENLNWVAKENAQVGFSSVGFYPFYHALSQEISPFNYSISDLYYPYWQNTAEKYFVFRWTEKNQFKYGWVLLSYTDNQLTVHKVFTQK